MDVRESFEKSVEQIKATKDELQYGVCCDCGGLMRLPERGGVYLCRTDGGLVDKYTIECEKCGKKDFFVVKVKHLGS